MKKLLLTGIAVLLAISAAYAADEELPPVAAPPVQAAPISFGMGLRPIHDVWGPAALLHGRGECTSRWAQRSRGPQWTPGNVTR
jgi:hypothetical protein